MSAYLGLRSRAFSIVAVFAALLLSLSFASSANAAGGGNGASDKVLTSGVEAYAAPGKGRGGEAGKGGPKTDRPTKPGNGQDPVGEDKQPWICHWGGVDFELIRPDGTSHTGSGHDLHQYDRIIAPGGTCEFVPDPITLECPTGYVVDDSVPPVCEPISTGGGGNTGGGNTGGLCDLPDATVDENGDPCDAGGNTGGGNTGGGNTGGETPGAGTPPVDGETPTDGDDDSPGGGETPGDKDTDGKPGKDTDGKPGDDKDNDGEDGDGGVKPIIKPVDKTPIVKGVDKVRNGVKPTTGNPVAQPQTGSPSTGTPAGVAPAGTTKNRPGANVLPNTGLEDHLGVLTAGGLALLLMGGVLVAPRRRPVRVAR